MKKLHVFVLFVEYISYVNNILIVPEMAGVSYYNPKYFEKLSVNVRRNGRNSSYFVNSELTTLFTMNDDNVVLDCVFFEYLHNEYRRSFVQFQIKGCRNLLEDQRFNFGAIFKPRGIHCPLPPGHYILANVSLNEIASINQMTSWPLKKAKIEVKIHYIPGNILLTDFYGVFRFTQNPSIAKKKS